MQECFLEQTNNHFDLVDWRVISTIWSHLMPTRSCAEDDASVWLNMKRAELTDWPAGRNLTKRKLSGGLLRFRPLHRRSNYSYATLTHIYIFTVCGFISTQQMFHVCRGEFYCSLVQLKHFTESCHLVSYANSKACGCRVLTSVMAWRPLSVLDPLQSVVWSSSSLQISLKSIPSFCIILLTNIPSDVCLLTSSKLMFSHFCPTVARFFSDTRCDVTGFPLAHCSLARLTADHCRCCFWWSHLSRRPTWHLCEHLTMFQTL